MNALRRRKPATGDAIRDSLMLSLSTLAATWIDADLKAVELEGLVEAIVRENAPAVLEICLCQAGNEQSGTRNLSSLADAPG